MTLGVMAHVSKPSGWRKPRCLSSEPRPGKLWPVMNTRQTEATALGDAFAIR
jgi:hypothetical protein